MAWRTLSILLFVAAEANSQNLLCPPSFHEEKHPTHVVCRSQTTGEWTCPETFARISTHPFCLSKQNNSSQDESYMEAGNAKKEALSPDLGVKKKESLSAVLVVPGPVAGENTNLTAEPKCTFLTQTPRLVSPGSHWCRQTGEHYRYCPSKGGAAKDLRKGQKGGIATCPEALGPFPEVDDFSKALAGKHVVFMGDSRVRYQYMNLVDALVQGDFMQCADVSSKKEPRCRFIDEKLGLAGGGTWKQWYVESKSSFNDKASGSSEICDCFRPDKGVFRPDNTHENRFFRQSSDYGEIMVTFLMNFEDFVHFHEGFPPFEYHGRPPCHAGDCNATRIAASYNTRETITKVIPLLNATHLFASSGWHQKGTDIGCALADAERTHGIHAYYITHTNGGLSSTPKLGCGVKVIDRVEASQSVPRGWFWDGLHVLSILNRHYNNMILSALGAESR